jgi:hypothetical protein
MRQTNRWSLWIDNVNCAAIGDVDTEHNASLVRDDSIATDKFFVRLNCVIDNRDFVRVNLLDGYERPIRETDLVSKPSMFNVQPT